MILRGWYSQDGWRTKLILMNQSKEVVKLRIKLFEGGRGKLLATINMRLKPKEMRFYNLDKIKRVSGKAGVILIDSEKPIVCSSYLTSLNDEMKVLDYRLVPVEEPHGCY